VFMGGKPVPPFDGRESKLKRRRPGRDLSLCRRGIFGEREVLGQVWRFYEPFQEKGEWKLFLSEISQFMS